MGKTLDLGLRLELEPLDKHCHNLSVGLYRRDVNEVPQFQVHTYSTVDGAGERVAFLSRALVVMLGLEQVDDSPPWLRFTCKSIHERALKRGFLDLCKIQTNTPLEPKPLTAFDKKANGKLTAVNLGQGAYRIDPEPGAEAGSRRAEAVARGFAKLCEMDRSQDATNQMAFPCKTPHDALIGMLLFRAQNVRAAMQEEEMASARGMLASPSQQK